MSQLYNCFCAVGGQRLRFLRYVAFFFKAEYISEQINHNYEERTSELLNYYRRQTTGVFAQENCLTLCCRRRCQMCCCVVGWRNKPTRKCGVKTAGRNACGSSGSFGSYLNVINIT